MAENNYIIGRMKEIAARHRHLKKRMRNEKVTASNRMLMEKLRRCALEELLSLVKRLD